MFELWRQIDWKSCFWKIWVEFKGFWKTFHLILMHFIHKTMYFEEFLYYHALFKKKKKTNFSRFLIDRTCCSTDKKCDKNFGYNLLGSIGARLVLRSIKIDFRSVESNFLPIENRSVSFLKQALTCSSLYSNFSKIFLLSLFNQSTSWQIFVVVFLIFLKVFVFKCWYALFTHSFSFYSHISCILGEIFGLINFWDFWFFGCFLSHLIHGFLSLDAINLILML